MKLASLVNLKPLKEESTGAFGMAAKDLAATYSLERLQQIRDEVMGDMEQEAEPEGGNIADMYADQLHGLDQAIALKQPKKDVPYDVAVGKMTQDEYDKYMSTVAKDRDTFEKSSKFKKAGERSGFDMRGLNEATEKSWNSIDVSRKAEKEIGNREWNERTTKKLDMLIALNKAGKFKKDFDEERLQGWVDQNYSWEKLSRQFKLNESYSSMYETNTDQALQVTAPDGTVAMITDPRDIGDFITGKGIIYGETQDGGVIELHIDSALDYQYVANEGSCGYGPDGVPGDTPGETKGMPAKTRTITMMRETIKKEIKKLYENK